MVARTLTPQGYYVLAPGDKLKVDAWVASEGVGPLNQIKTVTVLEDGEVEIVRYRVKAGHKYLDVVDGERVVASETFRHRPTAPFPVEGDVIVAEEG